MRFPLKRFPERLSDGSRDNACEAPACLHLAQALARRFALGLPLRFHVSLHGPAHARWRIASQLGGIVRTAAQAGPRTHYLCVVFTRHQPSKLAHYRKAENDSHLTRLILLFSAKAARNSATGSGDFALGIARK